MVMTVLMASAVSSSLEGDSTSVLPRYLRLKMVSGTVSVSSGPVRLLLALLALVLALVLALLPPLVLAGPADELDDGPTDSQLFARAHSSHSSAKEIQVVG